MKRSAVVAVFSRRIEAEKAVAALQEAGFSSNEIGFAIRGADVAAGGMITDEAGAKDRAGAVAGITTGGAIGGVLGALAALVVPGVGPVLAGGILAAAFGGAAAGAAIGGLLGAMKGLDVSEEEAQFYEKEFEAGRAIVAVKAGARVADAAAIMKRYGGYDMQRHAESPVRTTGPLSEP
jgi:MFS family permease